MTIIVMDDGCYVRMDSLSYLFSCVHDRQKWLTLEVNIGPNPRTERQSLQPLTKLRQMRRQGIHPCHLQREDVGNVSIGRPTESGSLTHLSDTGNNNDG